jgi:cytochrome c oxidase subunit II
VVRKQRDVPQQPRRSRFPALAVAAVLLSACIQDSPLDSLDPQGPFAQTIDNLFWVTFWIATGIFVLVQGGILLAVFLFREKPDSKEPRQIHGNTRLEVAWTVIPALILAGIAVPTVRTVFDLTECGAGAMPIEVIGHQWWFEYRYPESGVISANVLVIPAGQEVCLTMTSDDVIHNYWIPKLNGKRYLVPGEETFLRLQADEPGEYWGQCGEFCGLSHALMRARVNALAPAEFEAWTAAQLEPALEPEEGSPAARGREVFLGQACIGCHNISDVNPLDTATVEIYGPDLTHFASRNVFAGATLDNTPENLAVWLANPPGVKPGSFMPNLGLSQGDIDDLIAYMESLR